MMNTGFESKVAIGNEFLPLGLGFGFSLDLGLGSIICGLWGRRYDGDSQTLYIDLRR